MIKKYLRATSDGKGYMEVELEKATQVSVSLKDMEQLERTLEDQHDHIMKADHPRKEQSRTQYSPGAI